MQSLVLYIGFGLVTASILCIGAVGFTLQFGISNLFNLAFGATMTAAAFVAYVCNSAGLNIWLSLVLATLAASLLSFLMNRGIYLPFERRATGKFTMIMVTLGVGIIIQYGIEAIWGGDNFSYNMAAGSPVHVASMLFTTTQLTVIVKETREGGRSAPLRSAKVRDKNCRVVRRRGRVYVINKKNPRMKCRQG